MRMLRAILTIIICLWGSILMPLETHAAGQDMVQEIAKAKQGQKDNYKEELGKSVGWLVMVCSIIRVRRTLSLSTLSRGPENAKRD